MAKKNSTEKPVVSKVKLYSSDGSPVIRNGKHIETKFDDGLKPCLNEDKTEMVDENGEVKYHRPRNIAANPASAAKKLRAATNFMNDSLKQAEACGLTFGLRYDEDSKQFTLDSIKVVQEF